MNNGVRGLKNVKLKYQLIMLVGMGIFMMILAQLVFYIRFCFVVEDNAELYALNTIKQANDKLNTLVMNIQQAAHTASYNTTTQEYMTSDLATKSERHDDLMNLLQGIQISNPIIADIGLIYEDDSGKKSLYTKSSAVLDYSVEYTMNKLYNFDHINKAFFTPVVESSYCAYISPIYNIFYQNGGRRRLGVCIILCRIQDLQNIVMNTSITPNSLFLLVDSSNRVAVSNKTYTQMTINHLLGEDILAESENEKHFKVDYEGSNSLVTVKTNKVMQWSTVSIIPLKELTNNLQPIRISGLYIAAVTVILLIMIGYIFSRSINSPISYIVRKMNEIGEKNLKQRIQLKETNEIGIIATDINQMLDKIEAMTGNIFRMQTKLYEAEISKQTAELSALQSQINPHFLYNTLECMRSIATSYGAHEIESISTSMAKIFRYSIKGSTFTTVREEVDCIKDYLIILSIRFEDKITTEIEIAESLMQVYIIKMILQPIVENAIYHGLETKDADGRLVIKAFEKDEKIIFEIADDGVGISEQDLEQINQCLTEKIRMNDGDLQNKRSIGLFNINNRIKIYYGDNYGLYIYSQENVGTTVKIEMPLETKN